MVVREFREAVLVAVLCVGLVTTCDVSGATLKCILAGDETALPSDTPSNRLDGAAEFPFVGALAISGGSGSYKGSAVAISPEWILTAGHNADLNDDGTADAAWNGRFHLPGFGVYEILQAYTHPAFNGFANPSVNDDLALLRLAAPLPDSIAFPGFGSVAIGETVTLVGFGRSGYGSYGYTTAASLTDRRFGDNVVDRLSVDDEGSVVAEVFRYDFDAPATAGQPGGSLGNDVETIIGPGDSGGAALKRTANGWQLVGINTFTEGYGGRFGDTGGGVLVAPYLAWINQVTGIPEASSCGFVVLGLVLMMLRRQRVWQSSGIQRNPPPARHSDEHRAGMLC